MKYTTKQLKDISNSKTCNTMEIAYFLLKRKRSPNKTKRP